jgi:hypothetical protein
MVGACVSFTVTVKVQVAVLPEASVAVEVTVVVPVGNRLPEAGTLVTTTPGQLSVAVALKFTIAPHMPVVLLTVIFAGQVITGGCASITVTVNEQIPPPGSVAVTVVVPRGKNEPDAGVDVTGPHTPLVVGAG